MRAAAPRHTPPAGGRPLATQACRQPARWVASTDGATVLVLAVESATGLPVPVTAATGLRLVHLRDHGDNERSDPGYDHLHQRPYRRGGAGREPDEVELSV